MMDTGEFQMLRSTTSNFIISVLNHLPFSLTHTTYKKIDTYKYTKLDLFQLMSLSP
jgi:hypothetical protein